MRARFGLGVTLAALALAQGAHADKGDGALNSRERRAVAASGLPPSSVVYAKSDLVVAIRNRGTPSDGGGVFEGVVLQGEVISDEAARVIGYRSMRSTVNVDCVRRRDMVVKMTVFTEPQAKGVAINRHVPGGWVQPSPDAYLAQVIRAVCGPAQQMAAAPPVSEKPAPSKPAPRPAPAKPAKPAKSAPLEIVELAPSPPAGPPVPTEEAPMRTSVEARRTRPASAALAAVPATSPAAASVEAASQPALDLRPLTPAAAREGAARPTPTPPRTSKPKTAGKVAVQIAAAASEPQAREALAKIKGKVTPPLTTAVRSVVVDGKTFHRALVTGFQTRAEAQAFCNGLKGDCFIR